MLRPAVRTSVARALRPRRPAWRRPCPRHSRDRPSGLPGCRGQRRFSSTRLRRTRPAAPRPARTAHEEHRWLGAGTMSMAQCKLDHGANRPARPQWSLSLTMVLGRIPMASLEAARSGRPRPARRPSSGTSGLDSWWRRRAFPPEPIRILREIMDWGVGGEQHRDCNRRHAAAPLWGNCAANLVGFPATNPPHRQTRSSAKRPQRASRGARPDPQACSSTGPKCAGRAVCQHGIESSTLSRVTP